MANFKIVISDYSQLPLDTILNPATDLGINDLTSQNLFTWTIELSSYIK